LVGGSQIEGQVLTEAGQPLRRARVALRPLQGKYTLVAWLEDDVPCDVYDPDALDACRALSMKAAPKR
jgi:hypothetical protein